MTSPPPAGDAPAPLTHQDQDAERDQPQAPEDVAEEVRGVDDRQLERREHADEDQRRRDERRAPRTSGRRTGGRARRPPAPSRPPSGSSRASRRSRCRGCRSRSGTTRCRRPPHSRARGSASASRPMTCTTAAAIPTGTAKRMARASTEPADADRDRREQRGGQREDREPGADGALVRAEVGQHLARRLVEHVGVVEDRAEGGEANVGQDRGEDQQDSGELRVHDLLLGEWLAPAIQATRTLSGWSTRWSRASASTSSRSPRRCAPAMATSWRSRVVAATLSARASSLSPSGAKSAAATEDLRVVAGARRLDDRRDRRIVADHETVKQVHGAATVHERALTRR